MLLNQSPQALATDAGAETSFTTTKHRSRRTPINYQEFYTINEDDSEQALTAFPSPSSDVALQNTTNLGLPSDNWLQRIKIVVVNMLKWYLHYEPLNRTQEKYSRLLHFGRWINDPDDDTCMNTRARVLVRDSETEVIYKNEKRCVVAAGKWHDPYSDQDAYEAKQIQIDHMVPLKNAYVSGASDWDFQTRCLYANYLHFKPHLVSADGHENMSKGDDGPENYLPPNERYRCEYVRNWLAIKTIWKLKMNRDEVLAIQNTVKQYNCDLSSFKMSLQGLANQRAFIQENLGFCNIHGR